MMGRLVKRFLILTLSAASLLFAVLVTGCNNIVENEVESESPASVTEIKTKTTEPETIVTVSGSLNIRGAFPEEIVNQLNHVEENSRHAELVSASNRSRTAFPSIPETGLTAEIKAVKVSDSSVTYDATSIDWEHRTFTIGVPVGSSEVSYKITADIKYADKIILSGESEDFSISSENPLVDASLTLGAKKTVTGSTNTNGKGNISLEIEIEDNSEISYCKIKIQEGLFYTKNGGPYNVSDGKILITETDVYSYNATVEFKFYSTSDALLYSFTESVSIFDNLTTNTWVKNGNDPWLVTSGSTTTCYITNAMVEGNKLTEIWINPEAANDSGSGSFLHPKKTFSGALAMLNNAEKDYTIFIKGSLIGNSELPNTLKNTGSGEEGGTLAHSLTICGDTGLDNSGLPQDELKGTGTGTVLTINTNVPVIIKNLKITGGKQSADSGGGIYINNSEANVYLTNGALITGNQAKVGGGAYVAKGNLFVYGSAVIGKRGVLSHAEDDVDSNGNNKYGNLATTSGGGIGVGSGTLWLGYSAENVPAETSGGVIYNLVKGDSTTHGGGIDNQNGSVKIAAGNVSYNYASSTSISDRGMGGGISTAKNLTLTGTAVIEGNNSCFGGGVLITYDGSNSGQFEMTGGTISSNSATGFDSIEGAGGGIAVAAQSDATGTFTMSGGKISSNTAGGYGGAVAYESGKDFIITDSAYIPYDSDNPRNDLYIAEGKWISLKDPIEPPSECSDGVVAVITPENPSSAEPILKLDDSATTTILAEMPHFAIKTDTEHNVTRTILSNGKVAVSMVLTNSNIADFKPHDLVANQEYHFVIGADVTDTLFTNFIKKLCTNASGNNSAEIVINEASTLDLSRATSLTKLALTSFNDFGVSSSASLVYQKFDTIIIGPNFDSNVFANQDVHAVFTNTKNIIAPSNSTYYSSDSNGVLYNKDGDTIVWYPGNSQVSNYEIPDGVTHIDGYAFSYVKAITSVIANSGVSIGDAAFFNASGVTSVSLPDDNPQITIGCEFQGCGITSFTIPSSWTYLPSYSFRYSSLTSIHIPGSVTTIESQAFAGCSSLASMSFDLYDGWKKYSDSTPINFTSSASSNATLYQTNYSSEKIVRQ